MAREKNAIERLADSAFMKKLQVGSQKLASNEIFATISGGMGAGMSLIMIGAVIQIICAVGVLFGWDPNSASYQAVYMPYKVTMGLMGLFLCFSLAYTYAKRKKMNQLQAGFTALVCYILVVSPVVSASVVAADGTVGRAFDALNLANLGTGGIFVAIIIGIASVSISNFSIKHNWMIRLPDVVPEGIANSFNAIIPMGVNIIFWYGLSLIISAVSGGALTLASVITLILSVPVNFLTSTPGMFLVLAIAQLCWFFGIHGTTVIMTVMMVPFITAYTTNANLAASGQPLQWFPIFLMLANGVCGGAGNTLVFSFMGLKSKSKRISAVSKASFVPGLFGINEPAIFGYPIMYNAVLMIPFILCPLVVAGFMLAAYSLNLMALPQVLMMTTMPVLLQSFLVSLDWRNVVFAVLMFPVCWLIWRPFYKVYERQCIEEEAEAEAAELAAKAQEEK
ncbi:PTS sugar transporter subunit IIC [Gemmiger sp.]